MVMSALVMVISKIMMTFSHAKMAAALHLI